MIDISGKNQERLDPETSEAYLRQDDVNLVILVYGAEYYKELKARNNVTTEELAKPIRDRLRKCHTLEQIAKELVPESQNDSDTATNDKPSLTTISALDLQRKDIPPVRWIVKDLIPAGLTLLASPPKFGKSWAALDLCLSVAAGGRFLGFRTNQCGCLYLALEDGERRLKSRMEKIIAPLPAPSGFDFATLAPTLSTGLIEALERYMKQHAEVGLIVVDTLQKIRDMGGGKDIYGRDYNDIATLKRLADTHNIALLLIHHLRKATDDSDPFARISGTNGLSGAADSMWVLSKERRGDDTATLSITGRDVEQAELALRFNKSSCRWENLGDVDTFAEQRLRQDFSKNPIIVTIKTLLRQSSDGTWSGTATQLLDAGNYIARTRLADNSRALTNKLSALDKPLFEYSNIIHQRKRNGNGGGQHQFYYADLPPLEDVEQTDFDPFSEV